MLSRRIPARILERSVTTGLAGFEESKTGELLCPFILTSFDACLVLGDFVRVCCNFARLAVITTE
jgi:hypothetical protein